jgi:integrase/recombinase XerC
MDKLIEEFLGYLKFERNRSDYTVENYGADLEAFHKYINRLDAEIKWDTVDADIIRGWMEAMMDKGNKATSINRRLSSVRMFYRFAVSRKKLKSDPAHQVKGPKKEKVLPQFLREDEMNRLLSKDYWDDSFKDLRSRMIILTFYSTGIRLSELAGLNENSIDFRQNELKVLGKRNKERIIPFGAELKTELADYQSKRNEIFGTDNNALFVDDKGHRMTSQQIRKDVIKNISKVSTMKKRSPHVLRHTFATAMLNNDSDIESVRKLLGHESISATEIYTHTTFEQLRKVYAKAHPRGENKDDQSEKEKTTKPAGK